MKKKIIFFLLLSTTCWAQFAPPAGQTGSTAVDAGSAQFVNWAHACTLQLGYQNISNTSAGLVNVGSGTSACGKALEDGIVSLGDAGVATLTFPFGIVNESGADFAVFENSFSDDFLELAFVEVSSDGINFFRFPAVSNTQVTTQTESFGLLDATKINNLAGKYRAGFGTPFDLEELKNTVGLDVNNVTHVKIVDVVGSINFSYATKDVNNNIINDPFPTEFPSGGFDLDAVGVIHQNAIASIFKNETNKQNQFAFFPNPAQQGEIVAINVLSDNIPTTIEISSVQGNIVQSKSIDSASNRIEFTMNQNGVYIISLFYENGFIERKKLIVND